MPKILITGACGQLGSELTLRLRERYSKDEIIASDIHEPDSSFSDGSFEKIDVLKKEELAQVIDRYEIDQVYHLAALLSAKAEQKLKMAWKLNMEGLLNVLELARDKKLNRVFWPSSIGVFGPDAPKKKTPQNTALNPTTVYGISKVAGEQWCAYFYNQFGVDVRSVRYPGLIGYKSQPGGGTTDYAVDIHYKALEEKAYTCFLKEDTYLPMMYMDDAVEATLQLMHAPSESIEIRTSYNLAATSFSPAEIAAAIQKHIPDFHISYKPDFRQQIADSWPDSIDDTPARRQWGWKHKYNMKKMVADMLEHLREWEEAI